MLELPQVTLICLTNKDYDAHKQALDKASEGIRWGARRIIMDADCTSIDEWNRKIVYELTDYVQTPFCFLFHADGYPINPDCWRDEWLQYDFIGAPWPLPRPGDMVSYRVPETGELIRVGNSVSLRSKRLLDAPTRLNLPWRAYYGFTNEDGFLCCNNRTVLEADGIRYAPVSEAALFSREHEVEENKNIKKTFAFHTLD